MRQACRFWVGLGGERRQKRDEGDKASVVLLFTQRPLRQSVREALSIFLTEWICGSYFLPSAVCSISACLVPSR